MNIAILKCEDHYEIEDDNQNFICSCNLNELSNVLKSLENKDKIICLQKENNML